MRIGVVGVGSVGSLLGALLAHDGHEVIWFDHKPDRARRLDGQTLSVHGRPSGKILTVSWRVATVSHPLPSLDAILVCVKAHQTSSALAQLTPLPRDTPVVMVHNGLPRIEQLQPLVDPATLFHAVATLGAWLKDDHTVLCTGIENLVIGRPDTMAYARAEPLAAALTRVGIPASLSPTIMAHAWRKLLVNAAINGLGTVLRAPNGRLLQPDLWGSVVQVTEEGRRIMNAKGFTLSSPQALQDVQRVCSVTQDNVNSTLQDILKGKTTEIDYLNGAIVAQGIRLNLPTPLNSSLVSLIHGMDRAPGERPRDRRA